MGASIEELRPRIKNAVELAIRSKKPCKFIQTVELILTFKGIDVKKQPEFRFRDYVRLPHGLGKESRICLVLEDELVNQYSDKTKALPKSLIEGLDKKSAKKIAQQCDFVLVRANIMGLVGRVLGPALGPRGKAPIAIPMNVDIMKFVEQYKNMTVLRSKDQPWVGCAIGVETMTLDHLVDNAMAVLSYVEEKIKRPLSQVAKIYIKTTSSPAIEV